MNHLGIIVEFEVPADALDTFHAALRANASASIAEPGCRQFDVLQRLDDPGKVVLYEIYDDQAAFTEHLAAEHTKSFLATAKALNVKQAVQRLARTFAPDKKPA